MNNAGCRRDPPKSLDVLPQPGLDAWHPQAGKRLGIERPRQAWTFPPAKDGQLAVLCETKRTIRDKNILNRHGYIISSVLGREILEFVNEGVAVIVRPFAQAPPAEVHLGKVIATGEVENTAEMPVVEALRAPAGDVPGTDARPEPPVERIDEARLVDNAVRPSVETLEDLRPHGLDAIARPHALRTVKVDGIELAAVIFVSNGVRQSVSERRIGIRVERTVTLLDVVNVRADRPWRTTARAERPADKPRKGIGRFTANALVLD